MTVPSEDPHRLLAGLHRDGVSLELGTLEICFLAALQLRAEQDDLASFDEDMVFDVFDQICDLVEPGVENARKRATHTIQRLRGDLHRFARVAILHCFPARLRPRGRCATPSHAHGRGRLG